MRPTRSGEVRLMEIVWVGSFEGFMNFSSNTPYSIKIVVPVCASLGAFGEPCVRIRRLPSVCCRRSPGSAKEYSALVSLVAHT